MPELAIAELLSNERFPRDRSRLGTAFAVSKYLAITAYHCLKGEDGGPMRRNVMLSWMGGPLISNAEFVSGDEILDYALLEIRPRIMDAYDLRPLHVSRRWLPDNFECKIEGFPKSLRTVAPFHRAFGNVYKHDSNFSAGTPAVQLRCQEVGDGFDISGMSGAPVIVGSDLALGLILASPSVPGDRNSVMPGGIVFACSIAVIAEQRPLFFRDVEYYRWGASGPLERGLDIMNIGNPWWRD